MKKITCFVLFAAIVMACNNAAENVKTTDSTTTIDVNTRTETNKDTSSYERMPNKMNDSTQQ